jgi:hypothetical protein
LKIVAKPAIVRELRKITLTKATNMLDGSDGSMEKDRDLIKETIRTLVHSGVSFSEFWERNSDAEFYGYKKDYVWLLWLHEEIDKTFEETENKITPEVKIKIREMTTTKDLLESDLHTRTRQHSTPE